MVQYLYKINESPKVNRKSLNNWPLNAVSLKYFLFCFFMFFIISVSGLCTHMVVLLKIIVKLYITNYTENICTTSSFHTSLSMQHCKYPRHTVHQFCDQSQRTKTKFPQEVKIHQSQSVKETRRLKKTQLKNQSCSKYFVRKSFYSTKLVSFVGSKTCQQNMLFEIH